MDEGVALNGRQKAAVLCVSLGPENAAEIFKHLNDDVIEQLTVEMARTHDVEPTNADTVLEEIVESALARGYMAEGGRGYAREVLERAVGAARAEEILGKLAGAIEATPFDFLRRTPSDQIYEFLRHEHPQTVSVILANLPRTDLAAKVLQEMPAEQQADVAARIALMGQTSPDVVKEVARVMRQKLDSIVQHEYAAAGGVKSLADILGSADRTTERNILSHLNDENQALAEEVRALLFVFEDILQLEDRSIQLVLKDVETKDLALALRGASAEVVDKMTGNLSERGGDMLREEMEYMPPQRRTDVEAAQSKVVAVIRKLEDGGEIAIGRAGEDDLLM